MKRVLELICAPPGAGSTIGLMTDGFPRHRDRCFADSSLRGDHALPGRDDALRRCRSKWQVPA